MSESNPQLEEIRRQVREGTLTKHEVLTKIRELAALVPTTDRTELLEQWSLTEEDLVYVPGPNRTPQLHPALQGLIAERLQFDGDVPELRTGALLAGGTPAVPVQTTARNPVVIGAMLRTAQQEVQQELAQAHAKQQAALEDSFERGGSLAIPDVLGSLPANIEGYEVGKAPSLRVVEEPTTFALSFAEKQELFTKALTSTQGRKSAVPALAELLRSQLAENGIEVQLGGKPKPSPSHRHAQWTIEIFGTKGEMNPRFSYLDVAARSLVRQLIRGEQPMGVDPVLYLCPLNTVEERVVGWQAVLY